MSSSIIRSFQNQLLFALPAFGKSFFHMNTVTVLQNSWTPNFGTVPTIVTASATSSIGNLNNETVMQHSSQNSNNTQCSNVNTSTDQRAENMVANFVECDTTTSAPVNLVICPEVTHQHNQEATDNDEAPLDLCEDNPPTLSVPEYSKSPTVLVSEYPVEGDSHSEYESDNESDDCIEFTDESCPLATEVSSLKPNSNKYVTLVSSESGYFECPSRDCELDEIESADDMWSDSDSDDGEIEFCSEVWDSFEVQALSPMMPCKVKPKGEQEPPKNKDNDNHLITSKCPNKVIKDQRQEETDYITTTTSPKKRVSFKCDAELVEVHTIVAWEYAYRAARKGPWEQYARDRCHFKRRISSVSSVLEPCLLSKLSASQSSF